jgi:hypothetical protein
VAGPGASRSDVEVRVGIEQSLGESAVRDQAAKFLLFFHREDPVLRLVQEVTEPVGIPTLAAAVVVVLFPLAGCTGLERSIWGGSRASVAAARSSAYMLAGSPASVTS